MAGVIEKALRCVAPQVADMRHDELLRLGTLRKTWRDLAPGKFGAWITKPGSSRGYYNRQPVRRVAPRPVYFLVPGASAKEPHEFLSVSNPSRAHPRR